MFNFLNFRIPLYLFILVVIIIIFTKFNSVSCSYSPFIKHQIDTFYVDVKEIKYDTVYITKTVKVETSPEIETDVKKKNFIIKNYHSIDSSAFIKNKIIILDLDKETYDKLNSIFAKGGIKNSFEYKLPTVEKTKIVPLYTSKKEACLYQIKGSLITLGVQAAIVSTAAIIYFGFIK